MIDLPSPVSDRPTNDRPARYRRPRRVPASRIVVFILLATGGAIADLWTKHAVFAWRGLPQQSDTWWLVEGYIGIETAVNIGAVFGIGAGQGVFFAALSILAAAGIVIWLFHFGAAIQWWLTVAMGCVMGGIIGNLYDRLGLWWQPGYPEPWKSGVRDWILWQAGDAYRWPNFNIADSLLVCGAAMLLWHSFFPPPESESGSQDVETRSAGGVASGEVASGEVATDGPSRKRAVDSASE